MSRLKANCPSCAAPIEFRAGSTIVVVCNFCRSAIARTDRKLEDLGKVAEIVQSKSPLKLGLRGEFKGEKFKLTGRAQIKHEQGGVWDEWYATFSNNQVGWLAEAQGNFYITFHKSASEGFQIPDYDQIQPGQKIQGMPEKTHLIVNEKGTAKYIAAEGEIPYQLNPDETAEYVDLMGKGGVFATIDYSQKTPALFYGQKLTLADMGLADERPAERKAKRVASEAIRCPNCGGTLDLKAPDETERITCPYCNSLLNVNQGNLEFLRALKPLPKPHRFVLDIGSKCSFQRLVHGIEMEIIGAMVRSVTLNGVKYFWHEYLLYNPKIGFRWLVHSENHWNFVSPVSAADVNVSKTALGSVSVSYNNRTYKIFQNTPITVEYVQGEFYWRVEIGDRVRAADFVSPPFMLSHEITEKEINWSLGTYLPLQEVQKAFGVKSLPKPRNDLHVAPNQPFPHAKLIKDGVFLLTLLIIVGIFLIPFTGFGGTVLNQEFVLRRLRSPTTEQVVESRDFELKANRNVRITASAPVSNSWTELNIDLINAKNNNIEALTIPIEYYFGASNGETWSEGNKTNDATISSVPAGKYRLRIEGSWKDWQRPMPIRIKVEQGVVNGFNFWLAFILLASVPVITLVRKLSFESKRWSESSFSPIQH